MVVTVTVRLRLGLGFGFGFGFGFGLAKLSKETSRCKLMLPPRSVAAAGPVPLPSYHPMSVPYLSLLNQVLRRRSRWPCCLAVTRGSTRDLVITPRQVPAASQQMIPFRLATELAQARSPVITPCPASMRGRVP